jgi:Bifunctional DNA primase/polymerase, N-terminal
MFPCRADKTPACEHWFNDAVADQAGIDRLWSAVWPRNRPTALIGVPTGVISGIAVIDIDPRRGGDKWFFENRDRLPKTRTHETQSFGQHLIYRHLPGLRCSTDQTASGVEVKADGGYVIWWPSHGCRILYEGPVAEFPRWLLDELVTRVIKRSATVPQRGDGPLVAGTNRLPRNLYSHILQLVPRRHDQRRVRGILSVVVHTVEGPRNTRLNWAAYSMRELIEAGVMSRANAETLLMQATEHYAAADGVSAAMATIRSGLGSAMRGPSPYLMPHN